MTLPRSGWDELYLSTSAPAAGRAWSEGDKRRESRRLEHRGVDEVRIVPCPPELTALLHTPLVEHGTTPDGRLFRGARGGPLATSVYGHTVRRRVEEALPAGRDQDRAVHGP